MSEDSADFHAPREGLEQQLRQLEDYLARAEASGETMPPQAREMVERLQEIIRALDGLTSSLEP